jgi:hypothetical protein
MLTHPKSSRRDEDRAAMKKAHHVARDLSEAAAWIIKETAPAK